MADREDGFESEFKDVRYEIHILNSRRADIVQALERLGPTAPSHERERLQEQIGACDAKLLLARHRMDYLQKRVTEGEGAGEELKLKPPLKKKLKR